MAQTAIQQRYETPRSGKSRDPREVARVLAELRRDCNVIAPPGLDGVRLPNGFSVVWTRVPIDARPVRQGGDAYNVGGGNALTASALDRLASAFGVIWDSDRSVRKDDGTHPYLVCYLAVGSYMGPDGMPKPLSGTNKTDLRDGSPQTESYRSDEGQMNTKMLRQQRQHIVSISESKARARAFRKEIGLSPMPVEQIAKPWVVFKIQLTGETDDPRTQRMFEMMLFQNAMNARAALYGPPSAVLPPATAAAPSPELAQPTPVDELPAHEFDENGELVDDDYDPSPPDPGPPAVQEEPRPHRQASQPVCRFGTKKGVPLARLSDSDLAWYAGALQKSVDDPSKARWREYNARDLNEALDEQAARRATPGPIGDGYDGRDANDPDDF